MNLKNINYMIMSGDIKIHVTNLVPPKVYGFVYYSGKGRYHIFISEELSPRGRQEVLLHEIYHIMVDMPKRTYIIGLDMQWEEFERKACCIAKEKMKKC
ncbi:MAG: hypothetical protein RBT06_05500 [Smithellaceae bacterium]|nr:hypothetical protein [Smithellaceae bacterium]